MSGWSSFEHSGRAWSDNRRRHDTWPARGAKHDAGQQVAEIQRATPYGYPRGPEEIFMRAAIPWIAESVGNGPLERAELQPQWMLVDDNHRVALAVGIGPDHAGRPQLVRQGAIAGGMQIY